MKNQNGSLHKSLHSFNVVWIIYNKFVDLTRVCSHTQKSLLILRIKIDFFELYDWEKKFPFFLLEIARRKRRNVTFQFPLTTDDTLCPSWERGHEKDFWNKMGVRLLSTLVTILEIHKLFLIDDFGSITKYNPINHGNKRDRWLIIISLVTYL